MKNRYIIETFSANVKLILILPEATDNKYTILQIKLASITSRRARVPPQLPLNYVPFLNNCPQADCQGNFWRPLAGQPLMKQGRTIILFFDY